MISKYTEYEYVHTYFTPDDDPELSDPELYEVFKTVRDRMVKDFNELGFAAQYGMVNKAQATADLLDISSRSVRTLASDGYLKSASMNDDDGAKLFLITNLFKILFKLSRLSIPTWTKWYTYTCRCR